MSSWLLLVEQDDRRREIKATFCVYFQFPLLTSTTSHIARPGPAEHKGSIGIVPTYFCRKIPKELHLKVLFGKHPSDFGHYPSRLLYFCLLFYDNWLIRRYEIKCLGRIFFPCPNQLWNRSAGRKPIYCHYCCFSRGSPLESRTLLLSHFEWKWIFSFLFSSSSSSGAAVNHQIELPSNQIEDQERT